MPISEMTFMSSRNDPAPSSTVVCAAVIETSTDSWLGDESALRRLKGQEVPACTICYGASCDWLEHTYARGKYLKMRPIWLLASCLFSLPGWAYAAEFTLGQYSFQIPDGWSIYTEKSDETYKTAPFPRPKGAVAITNLQGQVCATAAHISSMNLNLLNKDETERLLKIKSLEIRTDMHTRYSDSHLIDYHVKNRISFPYIDHEYTSKIKNDTSQIPSIIRLRAIFDKDNVIFVTCILHGIIRDDTLEEVEGFMASITNAS
ncbi:MAG: hypothetical protein ACMVO3_21760 [Thalassobaculum sp.]